MNKNQIAFLGLGVMGAPMTINLAKNGYNIKAWNRTEKRPSTQLVKEKGITVTATIAEAVADAEIIFTCLGDVPDVEEVIFNRGGITENAPAKSLIVDFSTIGSQGAKNIAQGLQEKGFRFLDAPISGGDIGAQNGTLTVMVGGKETDFQQCLPYFQAVGKNIVYCGDTGSGQAVKLCNQVLVSLYMVGICEALQLAKTQNINPQLVVDVCGTGAAASWALSNLAPKIIAEDYQPGFMIQHILKDLRLVAEISGDDVSSLGTKLARQLFQKAGELNDGQGLQEGTQAMMKAYLTDVTH
ncbi:MAG: NAD(P)-dependent oxidoreductase [Cyanobacterium sp. T60_A2020_053]|nr:NAD(P)-dependent oxidoreductase [Cyanobacterium sp. T60_A2020_053]